MADHNAVFERIEKIETKTIIIGTQTFEYATTGNDGISVILINGAGGPIDGWMKIWRRLREKYNVFCYNRPGIGQSSAPVEPQNGLQMVEELKAILHALEIKPPYVLVGHSLGGFIAELFVRHYPEEVKNVILLEPSTIEDVLASGKKRKKKPKTASQSLYEVFQVDETIAQLENAPSFPAIPLTVVAGTHPVAKHFMPTKRVFSRIEHLRKASQLSPHGTFILAHHSGHFPQLSDSKLVAETIEASIILMSQKD